MTSVRVTAEQLIVHPHSRVDFLEVAEIGLYRSVVPRGVFQTGEWIIYIPDGVVLPDGLVEELGRTGQLAGPTRTLVQPVRLYGELSQGLVCRPKVLSRVDLETAHVEGHNFADALRVTAWVPPIPIHLSGQVSPAPELVMWCDVHDIKRYRKMFSPGERVVATEKVHGTTCIHTFSHGRHYVSSKDFGKRRMAFVRDESNLYWRAVIAHGLPRVAQEISTMMNAERVGIFGEIFGKGVQDLTYGADALDGKPGYVVFDIRVEAAAQQWWLDPDELVQVMRQLGDPVPTAPRLYAGAYNEATLLELAEGRESVSGEARHVREGLVVRPQHERRSSLTGGRTIAKFVSTAYLTRHAATDFA
ncbi:RNA ligase (ATP) [Phytoactinopolyspora halotolerans]|uniref:RNA ligase (ATP) n=1 Tax=Phytoactinopolyspora halotolerans TaxID=1981512 RepID=A0A6L9S3U0_9ACTN|nr:RNA ligase (ATP) [Phytoactinopolyspora halotolerans]NED99500.1 RNA ligase (ATP) [Phytoactinopolyspora halotolerans]